MRIISGQSRGRKLFTPGNAAGIRPTSDRSREALFSILGQQVSGACVLDLYCGTGALGLEALSRGAKDVLFIDNGRPALELSRKNLALCNQGISPEDTCHSRIIKHDLRRGLILSQEMRQNCTAGFDIIFLDPPYGKGLAEKTLNDIDKSDLCASGCVVIAEESREANLPHEFTDQLIFHDKRRYGDTCFWFYTCRGDE